MTGAQLWWWFWVGCFVVAGISFAVIAAIVLVRGIGDLRAMVRLLEERRRTPDSQA